MSDSLVLARLRRFLLALAGFLFIGTLVELVFTGHTDEPVQWIPFLLCTLGLAAIGVVWFRPLRVNVRILQICMIVIVLGSLFGVYQHIQGNAAFRLETHPDSTTTELIGAALGGADPLVAPGILAVAAVLALAATYAHPALVRDQEASIAQAWQGEKKGAGGSSAPRA